MLRKQSSSVRFRTARRASTNIFVQPTREIWPKSRAYGLQFASAEEESVGSDLKYAWRSIWKSPATTIGAILALALGLGATTMIFGLFNAVLLRPLPYPQAERLVEIFGTVQREHTERRGTSFPDFFDWRDRSKSYDGMAAWISSGFIIYGAGQPELVRAEIIDGPYFELLGVQAVAGRMFLDSDHRPGASPVAVIGERLASSPSLVSRRRRFAVDPIKPSCGRRCGRRSRRTR